MIDFSKSTLTKDDYKMIGRIVRRAGSLFNGCVDNLLMDIEVTNMVCPLDLAKLEGFDDANLVHDLSGINRHLNRETGELENCFLPRCAKGALV